MSNLNRGSSSLSFGLDPSAHNWLLNVMHYVSSMKGIQQVTQDCDNVIEYATNALQRLLSRLNINNITTTEEVNSRDRNTAKECEINVNNCRIKMGDVYIVFYFHGLF